MEHPKKNSLTKKHRGVWGSPDILCITNRRIFSVFFPRGRRTIKKKQISQTNHSLALSLTSHACPSCDALRRSVANGNSCCLGRLLCMGGQLEMAFHMSVRAVCDMASLDARTWNLLIEDRFIPECSEFGGFSTAREIQWFPHTHPPPL
ncbi:hypothetical protein LX32DRAFT_711959 [Colletotrichum zoysiae]|uniref:Uncharacterized protein n=1 Tax=Colletotrichum zoysiae TaxID=1216348 RepID=A0AAD9H3L8_9PEZI|nr:hypothetical protein LX32DRAFT_711959 [Colletotrichum zoysiae]